MEIKLIERTSSMLTTPPQDTLQMCVCACVRVCVCVVNAHEQSCMMMIMEGSKMSKTEYDLKDLMYSAYDTPHKLYNISGNLINP